MSYHQEHHRESAVVLRLVTRLRPLTLIALLGNLLYKITCMHVYFILNVHSYSIFAAKNYRFGRLY